MKPLTWKDADTSALLHESSSQGGFRHSSSLFAALRHKTSLHAVEPEIQPLQEELSLRLLVGQSPAFRAIIDQIPALARCEGNVLLLGETGTGKELCARAIHYLSPRSSRPFVPVNCGAIPADLVENELFGHAVGAFTGATTPQPGILDEANGGTLFLDEIDSLPLLAQVKLLRFLQDHAYRPLGAAKSKTANLRIIAATNRDLMERVRCGVFRQDLYYRLKVFVLELPPLRQRIEDIPVLAQHFLEKYAAELDKPATHFSVEAQQALVTYDWPGNVRELEHLIECAVSLSTHAVVDVVALHLPGQEQPVLYEPFNTAKARAITHFEKNYLQSVLALHHGNITQAARTAKKHRRAFWQLLRKHGINAEDFKRTP